MTHEAKCQIMHYIVAEKLWSWIFCFCCLPKVRQHKKLQDHAFPLLSSPSSITRRQKSFWILCWALPLILEPGWARMNYAEPVWARMNYAEPGASELGAATQSLILEPGFRFHKSCSRFWFTSFAADWACSPKSLELRSSFSGRTCESKSWTRFIKT